MADHLTRASKEDVQYVFKNKEIALQNKLLRRNHRLYSNGRTKDKSMMFIARIPACDLFHPEWSKYFDPNQDQHERKKNLMLYLKKKEEFLATDKERV